MSHVKVIIEIFFSHEIASNTLFRVLPNQRLMMVSRAETTEKVNIFSASFAVSARERLSLRYVIKSEQSNVQQPNNNNNNNKI